MRSDSIQKEKSVKPLNFKLVAVVAMMAVMAIAAGASTIDLTFENIAPYPNNNDVLIENYYNGGTSSSSERAGRILASRSPTMRC